MQFKTTIITGIVFLLISSISIATPISESETPPQKTEQTTKKKTNFIQKIIFKKVIKKINTDKERASVWAIVSVIMGSLAFLAVVAYLIYFRLLILLVGALLGVIAMTTGISVADSNLNKKTKKLGYIGMGLGFTAVAGFIAFLLYVMFLIIRFLVIFF